MPESVGIFIMFTEAFQLRMMQINVGIIWKRYTAVTSARYNSLFQILQV